MNLLKTRCVFGSARQTVHITSYEHGCGQRHSVPWMVVPHSTLKSYVAIVLATMLAFAIQYRRVITVVSHSMRSLVRIYLCHGLSTRPLANSLPVLNLA
jgi:hypothetical protein